MTGIIDRIQSAIGSDYAKIAEFTHHTFHDRMSTHGHFGRAAVETAAEVCRRHPAVIGLGVGLLVDRLLVEEAKHHDAKLQAVVDAPAAAAEPEAEAKPERKSKKAKAALPHVRVTKLKPSRIAFEVFGGLLLLKMAASGAKIFRHKHQQEIWFAPAAKMHLFSATFCAYNLTKALSAKKVSAWRNGAILFFGTDAIKPVLKWYRTHPLAAAEVAKPAAEPAAAPAPAAAAPAPVPTPTPFPHAEPADATLAAVAHLQAHPYAMPQAQPMPEPQPANLHTLYS